jgi:fluoroquinolone resistance protein
MPRDAMHAQMPDTSSSISSRAHYVDQVFKDKQLEHAEIVSAEFYDCVFFHSSFAESVFRHCRFVNCVFRECDLSLIKVPESSFSSTLFENSKVMGVNWTEAHWPKAGLASPVSFSKCAISHSTFIGLSLQSIQIRDCVATDVDFREADLSQADFGGTDLFSSIFGKTNLSQADLSRARNYHVDPGRNILKQARFSLPEAMSLLHSMDIVLVDGD